MPHTSYLVIDVSTAPLPNAGDFIEPATAPENYKKPEAIAEYVREHTQKKIANAALDLDLNRITGIGLCREHAETPTIVLCRTEDEERTALRIVAEHCREKFLAIVTYNGLSFDLPLLMRRARYLGVSFPDINCDRYKSPHVDLLALLSDRDPSRRRALGFYVRRLGWTDLQKPLDGAEEARVHETGKWDELRASLVHDVTAVKRLAQWLGVLQPVEKELAIF